MRFAGVAIDWSALDLAGMVRRGQGSRRLPLTVRYRVCGEVGTLQVRPPMPAKSSTGWMMPPTGVTTQLTHRHDPILI
jgi:hypothetical protein